MGAGWVGVTPSVMLNVDLKVLPNKILTTAHHISLLIIFVKIKNSYTNIWPHFQFRVYLLNKRLFLILQVDFNKDTTTVVTSRLVASYITKVSHLEW